METYKASLPTAAEDAPANLKQVIFLFKSFCIWVTLIGARTECGIFKMLFLLWGEVYLQIEINIETIRNFLFSADKNCQGRLSRR